MLYNGVFGLPWFRSYGSNSGFRVFGDLDRDLWHMFFFLSHALRMMYWNIYAKFHWNPSSMNGWYAAVKVLINALCFIMGYLVAMVIRVTLFLLVQFFICFIVYVQSMCVPILRSIGTKLTKLEHMQKSRFIWFIWRHVTQKRYVMRHGDYDTSDRYFDKEHFENQTRSLYDFRFKSYGSNSGFRVFGDLDLDLWPMFYCLSHALRMMYWNIPCEVSLESVQ